MLTFKCSEVELIGGVLSAVLNQLATEKDDPESSRGIYTPGGRKFLELDMNMMSPVSWALSFGCLEAVKKFIESFKIFASISEKEFVKQHTPIFYSFVKQVLDLGLISLEEKDTTCCYANSEKVWATEPDGLQWEWYRIKGDSDTFGVEPDFKAGAQAEQPKENPCC